MSHDDVLFGLSPAVVHAGRGDRGPSGVPGDGRAPRDRVLARIVGARKRDPVAVVAGLGLPSLDLAARTHASNSRTEYALHPRTSQARSPPGCCCHHTMNG